MERDPHNRDPGYQSPSYGKQLQGAHCSSGRLEIGEGKAALVAAADTPPTKSKAGADNVAQVDRELGYRAQSPGLEFIIEK